MGVSTYLDSKHEGHCYGSKVGSGKGQSRRGEEVIDVIHRSHNGSKRCQEECRSNCPSKWGVSAAQLLVQGVLAPAGIDACR